ncbi:Archaeal putative transposase ISC1217 [Metallosphaera yellowstonensis MK1]|uniref:Archaeal putative transposase ISC1217 n=1 Tax=Metallosphaera yellowstonensis MK1 TaxID=671065 RepID=H2C5M1_9CREN|nr:transposase [Metallosphaera yellowstonensis]EHP69098.1 Archaeal putative transposase ISC1217 [Metallosphaera yellowstonensis MK1]
MTDNAVSELKSNRTQGRVGPGDPRGGGGTPPSGIPPGVYYADLTLGGRPITVKLLVRECKRDSGTHARYLYTTDLSLSEEVEEAWKIRWEIEDLQGTSRPWDSSFWRRERLQGYLTIFTINNVVRELIGS